MTTSKLADAVLQQLAGLTLATGDLLYQAASSLANLAGNTTATRKRLSMTSSVPGWRTLEIADGTDYRPPTRGILSGSGRDGTVNVDGTTAITVNGVSLSPSSGVYTLTQASGSIQAKVLNLSSGAVIQTAGYRVQAWVIHRPSSGTATIRDNGNATSGSNAGVALLAAGILVRSATQGGGGKTTTDGNGTSGTNNTQSYGGSGGAGGGGAGGAGGGGGTASIDEETNGNWSELVPALFSYPRTFNANAVRGGCGGGGGGRPTGSGGNAGGGGGGGGVVVVACELIDGAGTLLLEAKGGAGGPGAGALAGVGGGSPPRSRSTRSTRTRQSSG